MSDLDILLWAAGAPSQRIEPTDDNEMLCDLAAAHRLVNRLLLRIREERPKWCRKSLLGELASRSHGIRARTCKQTAALRELARHLPDAGRSLLLVKGFAAYAITNDPRLEYVSGDMDIFHSNRKAVRKALRALGYWELPRFVAHEYAALARGPIVFELHDYLPIESYPKGLCDIAESRLDDDPIETVADPPFKRLSHRDILVHRADGSAIDACGVGFPGHTTCAFIECAHLYRDATQGACYGHVAARLGSLATIRDLCGRPDFDAARFARMTEKYHAQDAMAFVGYMLTETFRECPVHWPTRPGGRHTFPRDLFWRAHWTASLSDIRTLLLPADGGAGVIERLSVNCVHVVEGLTQTWNVPSSGIGYSNVHCFLRTITPDRVPFRFSVSMSKGRIAIHIHLDAATLDPRYGFDVIVFVPAAYPYWRNRETFAMLAEPNAARTPAGLVYEFEFPDTCLDRNKRTITALIQVVRRPASSVVGTPDADLIVTMPLCIALPAK